MAIQRSAGGDNHGRRAPILAASLDPADEPARRTRFHRGTEMPGPPDTEVVLPAGHDATWSSRPTHPGLSVRAAILREFLRSGAHLAPYEPTGFRPGRPRAYPNGVPDSVVEAVRERIGFSPEEAARLVRQGPKNPEQKARRRELTRAVAAVLAAGRGAGVEEAVSAAYGWPRRTLHRLAAQGRAESAQ